MQGSHSSIFDVLCTHFRFTNKQSYSLPEGNQNVLTSECLVIFPPILISKKRIHRNSATTTTPWRAPPLLQRRRAAPLTPPRPLPGVSPPPLGAPQSGGGRGWSVSRSEQEPGDRAGAHRAQASLTCQGVVDAPPPRRQRGLQRRPRVLIAHGRVRRARRARAADG